MTGPTAYIEALRDAERSLREPASASDEGALVTLDVEQLEVTRAQVAKDWVDRGGVEALGTACRQAYDTVSQLIMERYFQRIEDVRQRAGGGAADVGGGHQPRTARPRVRPTAPDARQVSLVLQQLAENLDSLDRLQRDRPPSQPSAPQPSTEVVGSSENGRLRVLLTVTDGDDRITGIEADEHWARRNSVLQLGSMIVEAMNDGLAQVRALPAAPTNPYTELAGQFGRTADAAAALGRRSHLR